MYTFSPATTQIEGKHMNETDIAVAVYDTHWQAKTAVKTLQCAGFEMTKISIIGRRSPRASRSVLDV